MSWLDDEVRMISVRPPWADAIVDGHKPIENRRQGIPHRFRGWVVIQSSLTWSKRGELDPRVRGVYGGSALAHMFHGCQTHGYAIGRALLVDVHPANGCCHPWGEDSYTEDEGTRRVDVAHLVFEDPHRFARPFPTRGALGLWRPKPHVLAELIDVI